MRRQYIEELDDDGGLSGPVGRLAGEDKLGGGLRAHGIRDDAGGIEEGLLDAAPDWGGIVSYGHNFGGFACIYAKGPSKFDGLRVEFAELLQDVDLRLVGEVLD